MLLLDQAGRHISPKLRVPGNITLVFLPSRSPELNPVESVWQFLRDNRLSNRVFASCEDIVDHCCAAWNKLIEQPWRIMSVGLRKWAHRFRPAPAGIGFVGPEFARKRDKRSQGDAPREPLHSESAQDIGVARACASRSYRSRFMTLFQAATKSRTNFSVASSLA